MRRHAAGPVVHPEPDDPQPGPQRADRCEGTLGKRALYLDPTCYSCMHASCHTRSGESGSAHVSPWSGTIPATWGANGSFASLARMQLFANKLSGSLPAGCAPPP
jgi:hypothetical protein